MSSSPFPVHGGRVKTQSRASRSINSMAAKMKSLENFMTTPKKSKGEQSRGTIKLPWSSRCLFYVGIRRMDHAQTLDAGHF